MAFFEGDSDVFAGPVRRAELRAAAGCFRGGAVRFAVVFLAVVFLAVVFLAVVLLAVVFVAVVFFALALVGAGRPVVFLPEDAVFFAVLDVLVALDLLAAVFLVAEAGFLLADLLVLVLAAALVPTFVAVFAAFGFAVVFFAAEAFVAVFAAVVFLALVDPLGAGFFAALVRFVPAVLALRVAAALLLFATGADFVLRADRAGAAPRAAVVTKRRARPIRPAVVMDTSLRTVLIARARAANIRIRRVAAPLSTPSVPPKPAANRPAHRKRAGCGRYDRNCIDEDK